MSQESKKQPGKKQAAPKTSSTTSTTPKTPEALLSQISSNLAENIREYYRISSYLLQNPPADRPEVIPEEFDLVLLWDVKVVGKNGPIAALKGHADMPDALHPSGLPTALNNFQTTFSQLVAIPLNARVMRRLSEEGLKHRPEEASTPLELPPGPTFPANNDDESPDDEPPGEGYLANPLPTPGPTA